MSEDPYVGVDLLPDRERVSNRWLQVLHDMVAPAPMSHWASDVTTARIDSYDQIRPFVTRGALLIALLALLHLAPGTCRITWALTVPAGIQVIFEIALDFQLDLSESRRAPILRALTAIVESAHARTLVNATGVIGFFAVPCNIVAVCYFTSAGDPSWPKVIALAAAAAYGVSGILSFLTDATHYSAHQSPLRGYRAFRMVRPHVWLIVMVVMIALVGGSILNHLWAPDTEPLAWALCLFPVAIGMKQRDYERFLRASSDQLAKVQQDAKTALTIDYHNSNTDIRTFNRDLANNKDVPAEIRVRAAALAPLISLMGEAIDHDQWVLQQKRPSLVGIADKYRSDASLNLVIDIQLADLNSRNYEIARALIAALLANVGQAMTKAPEFDKRRVTVSGRVSGDQVVLAVRDPLPLITEWRRPGSTTLWLHEDLLAEGSSAGLTQHAVDPDDPKAGKEIRASWPVKKPRKKLRSN